MIDFLIDLLDLFREVTDTGATFSDAAPDAPGHTVHGGPDDTNIYGTRPSDIHGNSVGNDVWGRPNNTTIHG
jgi:hypothetical protein